MTWRNSPSHRPRSRQPVLAPYQAHLWKQWLGNGRHTFIVTSDANLLFFSNLMGRTATLAEYRAQAYPFNLFDLYVKDPEVRTLLTRFMRSYLTTTQDGIAAAELSHVTETVQVAGNRRLLARPPPSASDPGESCPPRPPQGKPLGRDVRNAHELRLCVGSGDEQRNAAQPQSPAGRKGTVSDRRWTDLRYSLLRPRAGWRSDRGRSRGKRHDGYRGRPPTSWPTRMPAGSCTKRFGISRQRPDSALPDPATCPPRRQRPL